MKKTSIFLLLAASCLFATAAGIGQLTTALSGLCSDMSSLLPVVAMLMVVLGAVIYASGQLMGAETRARANVWATAALTGAMVAVLITTVTPPILGSIYGPAISCGAGGSGGAPTLNCPDSTDPDAVYCPATSCCCRDDNQNYVCTNGAQACSNELPVNGPGTPIHNCQ